MRTQLTTIEDVKGCKIEGADFDDSPYLFLFPEQIVPIADSVRDLIKAGVISQGEADQEVTRRRREWEKDRRTQDLATLERLKEKYEGVL